MLRAGLVPMFDPRESVLGLPASVVVLAVALGALLVGAAWIYRLTRPGSEPEARPFRATSDEGDLPVTLVIAGVIAVIALFAVVAVVNVAR